MSQQQQPPLGSVNMVKPQGTGQTNQPIVHVRENSNSELEALFDVLKTPTKANPPGQSFSSKKLPASFFNPPQHPQRGCHSREGSQDSAAGNFAPRQVSGLVVSHSRSQSSPAQLPISLPPAPTPIHGKQPSADMLQDDLSLSSWDPQGKGGQSSLANGQQWQQPLDPQKSSSNQSLNSGATPTLSPSPSLQLSPAVSQQDLGNLPMGWEQGVTPDGEIYYINHLTKTTSWFDPRLPKHAQKPGPVRLAQVQQQQQIAQQQSQQLAPQLPGQPQNTLSGQQPPPQLSPNPPLQQRRAQTPNDKYIATELQKLQREKERLQREQDEIAAKENMLQELMSQHLVVTPQPPPGIDTKANLSISQQTVPSMQAITTSSVDPFLGQAGNTLESHARQNSADSGLGMGTSYSLPRTPEDFLSNVDEMDTQDGGHNKIPKHLTISSDFNMNELQGTMGMDLGGLGDPSDNPAGSMDSDELVPSLQEDIGNELLNMNDMDVPKMENLLYM